ncbi:uncharacterized protein [Coffea arabica]|uniref:Uncharacterized protein isoform X1 n=1 Tax=Coffea arabica TaxID=13443 RepID=A0ABM4UMC6_COFAR
MNLYGSIATTTIITPTDSRLLRNFGHKPSRPSLIVYKSMATQRSSTTGSSPLLRINSNFSALEARVSLVFALATQTFSLSQRLLMELASETAKYVFPSRRFESRTLEEALMSVPDIETLNFKVLSRNDQYEIREVESYFIAETTMPGKSGFDLNGASKSFNVLAEYLFGKNTKKEKMEMTTPVFTSKSQSEGEKMDMTTPVITKKPSAADFSLALFDVGRSKRSIGQQMRFQQISTLMSSQHRGIANLLHLRYISSNRPKSQTTNTNQVQALLELVKWKMFCKHIGWIVLSIDFLNKDLSFSNDIPNKVILHINVFRLLMIHLMFSQVYGILTITVNSSNTLM